MKASLAGVVVGLAVLVVVGFMGAVHPAGDSFAVFRVPFVIMLALLVIWAPWSVFLRWPLACACLCILAYHAVHSRPSRTVFEPDYVLYQQNLRFDRTETRALLAAIEEEQPDFITLQEVSAENDGVLVDLKERYPFQHLCPVGSQHMGEAVLSRHPIREGSAFCSGRDGLAGFEVETPKGPLWLVSLHVSWPWPFGQAEQVTSLLPEFKRLRGRVLLAGDFNAVAWSHTIRRVEAAADLSRVGHWQRSFVLPRVGFPIGIDHVLSTEAMAASIRVQPKLGSDHHGILAFISYGEDITDGTD